MNLLGSVDQQEEQRECARGDSGCVERESLHASEELVERRRILVAAAARPRGTTKSLDLLERVVTLETLDDPAECCREPAYILVERLVLGTRERLAVHDGT